MIRRVRCVSSSSSSPLTATFPFRYAKRPGEETLSIRAALGVNYLNDANSQWERAVEKWDVTLQGSSTMDPVFKDSSTRCGGDLRLNPPFLCI